jgi:hypothetical protein
MKNIFLGMVFLMTINLFAQVGIGTASPNTNSVLDLTSTNKALLLTRVANTAAVSNPTNGMLIYDISSKCVKGFENGAWTDCLSGKSGSIADVVVDCDVNGFQGNYFNNIAINATNKYSVTVTNNTFSTVSISFATSDLVLGGVLGVSVASVSPAGAQTFTPGQSRLIEYTLTGNPTSTGTLVGTWTKQLLKCDKSVAVNETPVFSINCAGATINNTLYSNEAIPANTTAVIPYVGNQAIAHTGQVVTSTGVTGLTATLAPGSFVIGAGTFTYNITGTPSGPGTANFAISMGMRSCTLAVTINPPTAFTNCSLASAGTMTINTAYTAGSVTQTVRVNVTKLGTYNITTNTVNNLSFSGSGTFTVLGVNDVVLVGTGTPNGSGNLTFTATLTGTSGSSTCSFTRYVRPTSVSGGLSGIGSNGCNGGATGASDARFWGWQDTGGTIFLSGGNYSLSFNASITARGIVYSGAPNKPLEGSVQYRLRNTSTGATYLQTSGNRNTYSGCQTRGVGSHQAGGGYSQSVGTQTLPAGNYVLQAYGESYMGGCSSGGGDSWAGCGLSVDGGSYTITAN